MNEELPTTLPINIEEYANGVVYPITIERNYHQVYDFNRRSTFEREMYESNER